MSINAVPLAYNFRCNNPEQAARIASLRTEDIQTIFKACFGTTVNIMQRFPKPPKCSAAIYIVDNAPKSILANVLSTNLHRMQEAANQIGGRPVNKYKHDPSHDNNAWTRDTPKAEPANAGAAKARYTPDAGGNVRIEAVPVDVRDIVNEHAKPTPQHAANNPPIPEPADDIDMDMLSDAEKLAVLLQRMTASNTPKAAPIDEAAVRAIARDEAGKIAPRKVELHLHGLNAEPVVIKDYRHPMFTKVLALSRAGLNVMMVGPAGSGKTALAYQVAQELKLEFGAISLTAGASESNLLGRYLPTGAGGQFEYTSTPFMRCYEGIPQEDGTLKGGLFLIDEFDAGDGNMLIVTNSATSNGYFFNDYRVGRELVTKCPTSVVMAACNTYGTGADVVYNSRNELDAATLDRFYIVHIEHDEGLDYIKAGIEPPTPKHWVPGKAPTDAEVRELMQWILDKRRRVASAKIRRVISPRATDKGVTALRAGVSMAEVKRDLLAGWSRDDLAKIGENV